MPPQTYRKLVAQKRSRNFREAAAIVAADLPAPQPNEVVVRNRYAGVNASDLNITAGIYFVGTPPPFDLGVEAAAEVVAKGEGVEHLNVGDHVLTVAVGGGYREYFIVDAATVVPVPEGTPEVLSVAVAGLTASVGLNVVGEMGEDETVLVTAAAGGVGQYAVQLAKQAGNHVIGTCSTEEKAAHLKSLGCDRVINYRQEDVGTVLKMEYPDGVNLVFEGVGRSMFDACVDNLAVRGRLVTLGFVSEYQTGVEEVTAKRIYDKLLWKSASVRGFLFTDFVEYVPEHLGRLLQAYFAGQLQAQVDPTEFVGLEAIPDAVEYLHAGKNCGKVMVRL